MRLALLVFACSLLPAADVTFETAKLRGSFHFFDPVGQSHADKADFPGVGECIYKPLGVPLVNKTRPNSLLLPEWILRPGGPRDPALWMGAFRVQPEPIPHGVRVRYPDKALARSGMRCTLDYRVIDDMILLDGYVEATRPHTNVELFFASYVPNRLNATYAPARSGRGIVWKLIPNRATPWKSVYFISSSGETRSWRRDGRFSDAKEMGDWSEVYDADWPFAAPILVAIEEATGLAVVHFVDSYCSILAGQHHPNDTAHDFAWGWRSLEAGQKFHTRAAVWITLLNGRHDQRMRQVYERYKKWQRSPSHPDQRGGADPWERPRQ
jgi:hypothetical protein